jgi:hypothetical protein
MAHLLKGEDTEGMTTSEARAYVKKRAPEVELLRKKMHDDLVAAQVETKRHLEERQKNAYKNRARTVEGAAEAARNMHKVDPAEREAMRAQYDAWWAEQMVRPARAKTPSPPKGKKGKSASKSKTGKKSGGRFTQKKRKPMFALF